MSEEEEWRKNFPLIRRLQVRAHVADPSEEVQRAPDSGSNGQEEAGDEHGRRHLLDVFGVVLVHALSLVYFHPGSVACGHGIPATAHVGPAARLHFLPWEGFSELVAEFLLQKLPIKQLLLLSLPDVDAQIEVE